MTIAPHHHDPGRDPMTMSTILIGVDASERSEDAIALARTLAERSGARLLLAAAVPCPPVALAESAGTAVLVQDVVDQTEERLEATAATLRDAGHDVACVTRGFVSPGQLLHTVAEDRAVDLIVVGSTHAGRMGRVLPGSTAERLLHGAPCPVAVAPAGYRDDERRPLRRIGVAFDGSAEAHAALRAGVALALRSGAQLDVVCVLDVMGFAAPALLGGPGFDRTRADAEAAAREHLESVVAELVPDARPAAWLLTGDPAARLAGFSRDLDLLLAGSRGYGPMHAVLLGGVSGRLIRDAACPLLITPRGAGHPLEGLLAPDTAAAPGR